MVHLRRPQLSGLGRNPAAPAEVLVRLAAHAAGRHGLSMREGQLPDPAADALLRYGGGDSAVFLARARVSSQMRRRMAGHPDPAIRDAYADFVRAMVDAEMPLAIEVLVDISGLSPTELAADPDPKLRAMVADSWRDRPMAVQVALLNDADPGVRAAATNTEHPGVPVEYYDQCLSDPAVRANVAHRIPLTFEQFERLLATGDATVLHAVAGNRHLTAAMVARLETSADPYVRVAVAYSRHVTPHTRDRLLAQVAAEDAAGSSDAYVALHWSGREPSWLRAAPLAERLTYLDCPHVAFRNVLATSRDLPDEAWRRLDDDPDVSVRRTAARRPGTPPEVLLRLLRSHGETFHVRPLLVDHPNFPRQALRGFAEAADPRIRALALEDADLPASVLGRLAACEDPYVRGIVARHPNTTVDLLERLLADPDPKVADSAAANGALPRSRMEHILTEAGL
ncbi:hypothetical protein [Streptomyces crystallinus]|uniref:Leucine rich repeat variant n=1 Tax=Streptomyces crystallinus TaxID=68191 RepID=A0ABN1GRV6_9ACTN